MEPISIFTPRVCGSLARWATGLAVLAGLAACSVTPQALTPEEVRQRAQDDAARMYVGQAPITRPVTLEEAVARALKYNLDYRLKRMESALALGLTEQASQDMLPKMVLNAGYRQRSNYTGGTSIGIIDGEESTRPTSSEERGRRLSSVEFSWNALDFGVSYYRARQQSNQLLVAEERRRKVVQNLLEDVRAAYWRALGAQKLDARAQEIMERARVALARSREAELQKIVAPSTALAYQRALLDATTLLNQRRQDLAYARRELAALMNVPPGVEFQVAEAQEAALPVPPTDLQELENMALLQRPELREEDLRKRINSDEGRKQLLSMLPGINLQFGLNSDSNRFAYNNSWAEGGLQLAWNLMRLVSLPTAQANLARQSDTDEARRLALAMAVITQTRIGVERYRLALEDFRLAEQAAQVDARLALYVQATVKARLDSDLEAIRTEARAVLGAYQKAAAYANAHIAFGRLYSSLGLDALPDGFDDDDLQKLTSRVADHLAASEHSAFALTSNLFGRPKAVRLEFLGVDDPVLRVRMAAAVKTLLGRNQIDTAAPDGQPLRLTLKIQNEGSIDRAIWTLDLLDEQGQVARQARYLTTLPPGARSSAYEASAVAMVTAQLGQLKDWLGIH